MLVSIFWNTVTFVLRDDATITLGMNMETGNDDNWLSFSDFRLIQIQSFDIPVANDDHRYTQQELIDFVNQAKEAGAEMIVTTEKDAVRMPRLDRCDVPIYYLRIQIDILSGRESFDQCISRICFM